MASIGRQRKRGGRTSGLDELGGEEQVLSCKHSAPALRDIASTGLMDSCRQVLASFAQYVFSRRRKTRCVTPSWRSWHAGSDLGITRVAADDLFIGVDGGWRKKRRLGGRDRDRTEFRPSCPNAFCSPRTDANCEPEIERSADWARARGSP